MALNSFRIRRALSLSSTLLQNSLNRQPKPLSTLAALTNPLSSVAASPANKSTTRPFTSTPALYFSSERKVFDPATDEIGPDTILFEGCDYNHWLITVDFPKDANVTREQMIDTYVNTAAQVFGSVEEAKKKIYALSTTTYQGFQVECSEETSKKFEGLPGVVFILPDSYIDPTNKEYGGDKYVNGEIFPRPPPVHYGRNVRERRQSYGPPQQQSNRPPPQSQNYGPPQHQQNYGPPPLRQDFGPPQQQQNYGPPPQQQKFEPTQQPQHSYVARPPQHQSYGPPPQQQNYGPLPQQQNYGPPPQQQNYGPPPQQQNYGPPPQQQNYRPPPQQQNYGPPPPQQQNYGPPPRHQNYGPPPPQQQNYSPPPQQQNYGPPPPNNFVSQPPQQQYSPPPPSQHGQGQRDFQRDDFLNNVPSERRGYP